MPGVPFQRGGSSLLLHVPAPAVHSTGSGHSYPRTSAPIRLELIRESADLGDPIGRDLAPPPESQLPLGLQPTQLAVFAGFPRLVGVCLCQHGHGPASGRDENLIAALRGPKGFAEVGLELPNSKTEMFHVYAIYAFISPPSRRI